VDGIAGIKERREGRKKIGRELALMKADLEVRLDFKSEN
jgi:hypothetical protein